MMRWSARLNPRKRLPTLRRRTPPGASPGTLVADPSSPQPVISIMAYGPEGLDERRVESLEELREVLGRHTVSWVDVQGLGDVEVIEALGEMFGLHRLALEDVVNVHQRPKVEEYADHLFIISRMPLQEAEFGTEQIALFLGKDYVLTFQEQVGDCFDAVRKRVRRSGARIREARSDYLAYALLDAVTDAYFPVLEGFGELVESLEGTVISAPEPSLVGRIHGVKRELLGVRRAVWPLREMFNTLVRDENPFVTEQTRIYFRDCYDHTVQLMDVLETYREVASSLVDIYLSSVSTRTNEIMKVLTMIATIFIPLGFIASLYGMNFDTGVSPWNMPELEWYFGYPFALGVMAAVAISLLVYFARKGWIGQSAAAARTREPGGEPGTRSRSASPAGRQ